MAKFRSIQTEFWRDYKVMEDFSPEDKYFMLYLLTNPEVTQIGIYPFSIKKAAFETGYNESTIQALVKRFEEHHKIIKYSLETKEIAIVNWAKYNFVRGGKPMWDCITHELKKVKNIELIKIVAKKINDEKIFKIFHEKIEEKNNFFEEKNKSSNTLENPCNDWVSEEQKKFLTIRGEKDKKKKEKIKNNNNNNKYNYINNKELKSEEVNSVVGVEIISLLQEYKLNNLTIKRGIIRNQLTIEDIEELIELAKRNQKIKRLDSWQAIFTNHLKGVSELDKLESSKTNLEKKARKDIDFIIAEIENDIFIADPVKKVSDVLGSYLNDEQKEKYLKEIKEFIYEKNKLKDA